LKYLIEAAFRDSMTMDIFSSMFSISEFFTEIILSALNEGLLISLVGMACSTGAEIILNPFYYPEEVLGNRDLLLITFWLLGINCLKLFYFCCWEEAEVEAGVDSCEEETTEEVDATDCYCYGGLSRGAPWLEVSDG